MPEVALPVLPAGASGSPPGHRSEVNVRLHKKLNLTEIATAIGVDQANGNNNEMKSQNGGLVHRSWANISHQVYSEELGREAYRTAMDKQKKMFRRSCQEGSLIKDVGIYFKEEKMKTLTGPRSLRMRLRRGQGQGMTGYAVFEKTKLLSHHPFFQPGRTLEVTGVHSNYPNAEDDASICTRTLGLKFSAHPSESPFDLMLHTGNISPAFTANAIEEYVASLANDEERKKYLLNLPIYLEAHIESVRAAPSSYYHQHYYGHVTYNVENTMGVTHPCRFRVVPADGSDESGRLNLDQQHNAWHVERSPTDNRPADYLKVEIRQRLTCGSLEYLLQVQTHDLPVQTPQEKLAHRCHMTYNQAIAWNDIYHPWETVANIKFTHSLPEDATEIVRYHIERVPSCITFEGAETYTDFNLVPHILKNACDLVEKIMQEHPEPTNIPGELTDYILYVATGDRPDSGNDTHVSICIVGTESSTAYRKLHQNWRDDISVGFKNTYVLTDKVVGEILCVRVYQSSPKGIEVFPWMLDEIIISTPYNGRCYTFPYYSWIQPRGLAILREGKDLLRTYCPRGMYLNNMAYRPWGSALRQYVPQGPSDQETDVAVITGLLPVLEKNALHRLLRQIELQRRRERYLWKTVQPMDPYYGLPGHLAAGSNTEDLQHELKWQGFNALELEWAEHMKTMWQSMGKFRKRLSEFLTIRREPMMEPYTRPIAEMLEDNPALDASVKNWHTDEEFGRQMLNGSNPAVLQRLDALPEGFPMIDEDLDQYVENGTFSYELQVGRVYMATYPSLENLEPGTESKDSKPQRHLCAPRVLLHVGEGQSALLPLIIQLSQKSDAPCYTPSDDVRSENNNYTYWEMAKLWVRCADVQLQLLDSYLLKTVLMVEPVTISLFRNMSSVHPISKLLTPHIRHVPAVATLWRKLLLPSDGPLSQVLAVGESPTGVLDVIKKQYAATKLTRMYLPEDLAARQTIDPSVLPNYYYRDDGLKVCGAIRNLCADVVGLHYRDDEEVVLDEELQDFLIDLKKNGLPTCDDLTTRFTTREEVIRFLNVVIFLSTAQHNAVTSGLIEDMAFTPASPPCLFQLPPTVGAPVANIGFTDRQLTELLPPAHISDTFTQMIKLLGRERIGAKLGDNKERHFTEPAVMEATKMFRTKLSEISASIRERNKNIARPYTRLMPELIPASLTA